MKDEPVEWIINEKRRFEYINEMLVFKLYTFDGFIKNKFRWTNGEKKVKNAFEIEKKTRKSYYFGSL